MRKINGFIRMVVVASMVSLPVSLAAQSTGSKPVRTVLAVGHLPTVVEAPMHFRLLQVTLPPGASTNYRGAHGMVYLLSGAVDVTLAGEKRALQPGDAIYVSAGSSARFDAPGNSAAMFLHFLLLPRAELNSQAEAAPAQVTELHRMAIPPATMKPGPYEFSMVRVTLPVGAPTPPLHYRSGAALYYVLEGGAINFDGKTEPRPRGAIQEEPYGFIHAWTSMPDKALVLLQANISPEGFPEIIFVK